MRLAWTRLVSLTCVTAALAAGGSAGAQGAGGGQSGAGQIVVSPPGPLGVSTMSGGSAAISGDVLDPATGRGVAGAVVSVRLEGNYSVLPIQQSTDAKGRFVFVGLPKGSFTVGVSKFGYFDGRYGGSASPAGRTVALADGQWFKDMHVRLERPGAITGSVVDESGEPIVGAYVRALVQIRMAGRILFASGPTATTDDRGTYRLQGLTAGRYVVQVPMVQSTVPAATPESVINHDAGSGATADVLPLLDTGARQMPAIDRDPDYRLVLGNFATPPAPMANGRAQSYSSTYYPAATSATSAIAVEIESGQERAGIDVVLRPVPAFRVTGTVEGPPDSIQNLTLRLVSAGREGSGNGSETATALVGSDGRFGFLNVPPGAYTIEATRMQVEFSYRPNGRIPASIAMPNPPATYTNTAGAGSAPSGPPGTAVTYLSQSNTQYWGRQAVGVSAGDVSGVVVHMSTGATISGRLVSDTGSGAPSASLLADIATGDASFGRPTAFSRDGTFQLTGIPPASFFLRASGAKVKSIAWHQEDYTTRPFDTEANREIADVLVTLTSQTCVVTGSIEGLSRPDAVAAVVAFPVQRERWTNYGTQQDRIKSVSMTSASSYRLTTLPAGEYYVVAVDESQIAAWQDPQWLAAAAAVADHVSLTWGDTKSVDLKLVAVRVR